MIPADIAATLATLGLQIGAIDDEATAAIAAQVTAREETVDARLQAALATSRADILAAKLARTRLEVMVDKPGPDNTGVLPTVPRCNWNAPGTAGKVAVPPGEYEDLDFYGDCYPADPKGKYRFRNCWQHGGLGHPANNLGLFYCWNLTTGWATFEDCTFAADFPSWYRDGIVGHRFTARRCDIHSTNDGIGGNANGGGIIEQCWIHDQLFWRQDPAHTDGTHNDPIQIQGGGPWTIRGNTLEAFVSVAEGSTGTNPYPAPDGRFYGGSAIMLSEAKSLDKLHDVLIDGNWLSGGYAEINVNNNRGAGNVLSFTLGDNRYGRDVRNNVKTGIDKRWICLAPTGGTITIPGLLTKQRWDDDGTLLTEGKTTGIRTL